MSARVSSMLAFNRGSESSKPCLRQWVMEPSNSRWRIEHLAKECLRALKADDEGAYMKLIDTAKDTCITHLLWQTDAYLDSLAQAVVAQQNEGGPMQEQGFKQEEMKILSVPLRSTQMRTRRLTTTPLPTEFQKRSHSNSISLLVVNSKITKSRACSGWSVCTTTDSMVS